MHAICKPRGLRQGDAELDERGCQGSSCSRLPGGAARPLKSDRGPLCAAALRRFATSRHGPAHAPVCARLLRARHAPPTCMTKRGRSVAGRACSGLRVCWVRSVLCWGAGRGSRAQRRGLPWLPSSCPCAAGQPTLLVPASAPTALEAAGGGVMPGVAGGGAVQAACRCDAAAAQSTSVPALCELRVLLGLALPGPRAGGPRCIDAAAVRCFAGGCWVCAAWKCRCRGAWSSVCGQGYIGTQLLLIQQQRTHIPTPREWSLDTPRLIHIAGVLLTTNVGTRERITLHT